MTEFGEMSRRSNIMLCYYYGIGYMFTLPHENPISQLGTLIACYMFADVTLI